MTDIAHRAAGSPGRDTRAELLTRVASMYYLEDMTQKTIAAQLGLSRPTVWRLLTEAKKVGIVEINVNVHPELAAPAESAIRSRFALARTILIPDQNDQESVHKQAGREAALLLDRGLKDGGNVAIGMGRGARAVSVGAEGSRPRRCTVVSAIGGAALIADGLNSNDIATRLAHAFGGVAEGIYAPAYAENQEVRDAFLQHDDVRRTLEHARKADIAVVGIGDADDESLIVRLGCIDSIDMARMRKDGAVGDILGSFFNARGEPIAPWIENRVVGLARTDLEAIGVVIAVAPEPAKAPAILGALNTGLVHTLVTTLATAQLVLELSDAYHVPGVQEQSH